MTDEAVTSSENNDIGAGSTGPGFRDLPEALIQHVLAKLIATSDLKSIASLACLSRAFRASAHSALSCASTLRPRLPATGHATEALRAVLPHCRGLVELDLRPCHGSLCDEALGAVASTPSLRVLRLDHCSAITAQGVQTLCSGALTQLRELSLRSAGDIGDGAALSAPGALPSLTSLDLSWCHSVRGDAIAACAGRLQRLTLHGCELVDSTVCRDLRALVELDVAFTRVCDVGLMALAAYSSNLRRLVLASRSDNLWTTGNWSEGGLGEFRRLRPEVEVVFASC